MRVWGANDRINVAIVGIGGRGTSHLNVYSKLPEARVVGLCDVNQAAREKAQATLVKNTGEKAKEFEDMREAFADPNVEAVSIATPNHWHALAAIWAMKAGKDVYGEKPACYNIHEGQMMLQVARETKRMLQIGSQHRSTPFKMRAIAALQGGLIGDIYQSKGLCYKRRNSIGHKAGSPDAARSSTGTCSSDPRRCGPSTSCASSTTGTGSGTPATATSATRASTRWASRAGAWAIRQWPKTAYAHGGKFAYIDDQETPNTLTADFDFGGSELVFEVRGLLTGGEGIGSGAAPAARRRDAARRPLPRAAEPLNIMVGNLFYGTEGWAAMNDEGFQAFKGESNELVMEEQRRARPARPPACTCRTSWPPAKSRNVQGPARRDRHRLPERVACATWRTSATASAAS